MAAVSCRVDAIFDWDSNDTVLTDPQKLKKAIKKKQNLALVGLKLRKIDRQSRTLPPCNNDFLLQNAK